MSMPTVTSRLAEVRAKQLTSPFPRRIALCVALTVFNAIVVAKFAGVLYLATRNHPLEQAGVTLLFATLLGSLARVWFLTLSRRTR